jgi:hypothetical protein
MALKLLNRANRNGAKEPKVADLEWLVGDADTPQLVRIRHR